MKGRGSFFLQKPSMPQMRILFTVPWFQLTRGITGAYPLKCSVRGTLIIMTPITHSSAKIVSQSSLAPWFDPAYYSVRVLLKVELTCAVGGILKTNSFMPSNVESFFTFGRP